ncbi:hypothetical protein FFLO_03827 [Filobasidium floriforme]|uniref:Uncharacterized protein n=1 Tax=Filobasidium floriforme TaxID=5210 RepID=A0A8K0JLI9_9TREE|nr:uncharacterized protein HD553DRAFT_313662 [Filobasidium floriforme]KAG7532139.1 hypothetical protein FFLO_03827 [Filobasidium floriforme]KAH8083281.1 hypothetical protein HD553DRAFT_313662 [Filobasidium floriforme]
MSTLTLAPFEKLLPDTPDGWTEYHQAVDGWWTLSGLPQATNLSREQLLQLEHIALHVRRFPLRPGTIPLEEEHAAGVNGDMDADMPLMERRMREAWLRLGSRPGGQMQRDQAIRWYRNTRDTARTDMAYKKLVRLTNDFKGTRGQVLAAARSAIVRTRSPSHLPGPSHRQHLSDSLPQTPLHHRRSAPRYEAGPSSHRLQSPYRFEQDSQTPRPDPVPQTPLHHRLAPWQESVPSSYPETPLHYRLAPRHQVDLPVSHHYGDSSRRYGYGPEVGPASRSFGSSPYPAFDQAYPGPSRSSPPSTRTEARLGFPTALAHTSQLPPARADVSPDGSHTARPEGSTVPTTTTPPGHLRDSDENGDLKENGDLPHTTPQPTSQPIPRSTSQPASRPVPQPASEPTSEPNNENNDLPRTTPPPALQPTPQPTSQQPTPQPTPQPPLRAFRNVASQTSEPEPPRVEVESLQDPAAVLRLRLPALDVQAEIVELRRRCEEAERQRDDERKQKDDERKRREALDTKLQQAETDDKNRREAVKTRLQKAETKIQQAETKREDEARKREAEGRKREAETEKRQVAEQMLQKERLAGLQDLIAMSGTGASELKQRLAESFTDCGPCSFKPARPIHAYTDGAQKSTGQERRYVIPFASHRSYPSNTVVEPPDRRKITSRGPGIRRIAGRERTSR